ncbi:MAG: hypothetical protein ACRD12_00565 [Acidimicrobiales bacterium]
MEAVDKVIVTNQGAIEAKYGERAAEVFNAVDELIAADDKRGLRTALVAIDDNGAMSELTAPAVTDATDAEQAKVAIDGIFRALTPDYLMILGSVDVIPHVPMRNPMPSDGDAFAYGDVPYACEHEYSDDAADFIGPTRVLGRLPDATAAREPSYIVSLLEATATWVSRPAADYRDYLGMSARVWQGSTRLSLQNVFGNAADLQLSPTAGPNWPSALMGRLSHFVNCHGSGADPHFFGQQGSSFPIAHQASLVDGHLAEGTVATVECCYGAELYDPALAAGALGICNTYLGSGAYAFFGSSTIAYGPADGNGAADLICQFFLRDVIAGASAGRAALQARQDFVRRASIVDPADLKTLAQFSLMGDPSVQPVEAPAPRLAHAAGLTAARSARRMNLLANGLSLPESTSVAKPTGATPADRPDLLRQILELAGEPDLQPSATESFRVDEPPIARSFRASVAGFAPSPPRPVIHVVVQTAEATGEGTDSTVVQNLALIAREEGGEIVGVRKLFAR